MSRGTRMSPEERREAKRTWARAYRATQKATGHAPARRDRVIRRLPDGFRADTIEDVKAIVTTMLLRVDTLPDRDSISVAKTAASLCQVAIRCIEIGNIEPRLEALERQIKELLKPRPPG